MAKRTARPRKLKINEAEYKLVTRRYKSWSKKKTKTFGQIQFNRQLIELNPDQSGGIFKDQQIDMTDTVWHEILHGIIHEFDIPADGRKEEKIVTKMANALVEVFRKNPKLLEWTLQRIKK